MPADANEARRRLEEGNRAYARGATGDAAPAHRPFAAVLGCSDARAPIELIFDQSSNDLFVVRVAGNVLGDECLGSLEFARTHLRDRLRLAVVLGHTACGAVTVATDAHLDPTRYPAVAATQPLRAVVDKILPAVGAAERALEEAHGGLVRERPGYRDALIAVAVELNAALAAMTLGRELDGLPTVYGVLDLATRAARLLDPPAHADAWAGLARDLAVAEATRARLR